MEIQNEKTQAITQRWRRSRSSSARAPSWRLGEGGQAARGAGRFPRGRSGSTGARHRWAAPPAASVERLRPGVLGKTTLRRSMRWPSPARGGRLRLHRRRARARRGLCAQSSGVRTDTCCLSQRTRRAGARDRRHARALQRGRHRGRDSVAALVPRPRLEGEMGDAHMGLAGALMSQALRKLTATISKFHTLIIFINQLRMKSA